MSAANDEGLSGLSPAEKLAILAVIDGASFADAANSTGLPVDRVECIWIRHHNGLKDAMKQAAKQFIAYTLDNSPEPRPWDMMDEILEELGHRRSDLIPDNEADRGRVEQLEKQVKSRYREANLKKLPTDSVPKAKPEMAPIRVEQETRTPKPETPPTEDHIYTSTPNPDGKTATIFEDGKSIGRVPADKAEGFLIDLRAAKTAPIPVTRRAITAAKDTLRERLTAQQDDDLTNAMEPLAELMEKMPPDERKPWVEQQIEDWLAPIREQQAAGIEQHDSIPDGVRPAVAASLTRGIMADIMAELGFPHPDDVPQTEVDRERMMVEKQQRQEALKRNPQNA